MKLPLINISEQPNRVADDAWMFDTDALPCPAAIGVRPLTDTEEIAVDVVTIRERTSTTLTDGEVIDTFLSAEVDRRNRQEVR